MTDTVTFTLGREEAAQLLQAAEHGTALANWITTTALLGHASPGSTLDYVHVEPGTYAAFLKDFVAWTSGRKELAPGCDTRLREWGAAAIGKPGTFRHFDELSA